MKSQSDMTDNDPLNLAEEDRSARIVIRLQQRQTNDTADLQKLAQVEQFRNLDAFLSSHEQLTSERLIRCAPPDVIREVEFFAAQSEFPPLQSLSAFWRISVPDKNDAERLRAQLQAMPEIAQAYIESEAVNPGTGVGNVDGNPYQKKQGYLERQPVGVGARPAWSQYPVDGSDVSVIDLEMAWILDHEDLPAPILLYGDQNTQSLSDADHGAAVLGVIGALNNKLGVIGIAPNITALNVVSHYDKVIGKGLHVADAIVAATALMSPGDVLVLEVQRHQDGTALPTETDPADFHAIRQAAAKGIVVIEAAGNGKSNLDTWHDPVQQTLLNTQAIDYFDSGAVMVGASKSQVVTNPAGCAAHKRYYTSNYGSRVNCYAWGEDICTAGYGTLAGVSGGIHSYAKNFGQTSGATAIIAGVAALVQSWSKNVHGHTLTPLQMRDILANPATGTPQSDAAAGKIGVMPDLEAIFLHPPTL